MKKFASFIFLFVLLLLAADAFAAKRYWVSSAGGKWNSTANWSSTSGGGGGASVPSTSDTAYFDGGGTGNDTLDMNISVKRMEIASGYTGTIVQDSYTVTFGTSGATLSGGTFAGGSGSITSSGAFVISGCAFTSTSGTLSCSANFTYSSGSFTHNSGKLKFTATNTITGSVSLYQLEFSPVTASTFTIASGTTLTVNNTLTISGGTASAAINTGTIDAKGDITVTNTAGTASPTGAITITGTSKQTFTGPSAGTSVTCRLPAITINKSDTLRLVNTICVFGNWTYTAGVIDAGTSTVYMVKSATIAGTHAIQNLMIGSAVGLNIASGTKLTVNGNFTVSAGSAFDIAGDTIDLKGNLTVNNTSANVISNGIIKMSGTGDQTITGCGTAFRGVLPNIVINKPSGNLILSGIITVGQTWKYISGTLVTTGSTLCLSSGTINGSHTLNNLSLAGGSVISAGTTLNVDGTLEIATSSVFSLSGTIHARGNVSITSTNASTNPGTGTVIIDGTANQTFTGNNSPGTGRLPNVQINKTAGTLFLAGIISVAGSWTWTAGTIDAGTSTVDFTNANAISGKHTLAKVIFSGAGSVTIPSDTLTVSDTLFIQGSNAITLNTGVLRALGSVRNTNTNASGGGTATIYISGSANQTFEGSGTAGAGRFPKIVIEKDAGCTLTLNSIISVANNWTYIKGTVNPGTSSVVFYGSLSLDGQGTSATMPFYNVTVSTGTVTLTGDLDANNNLGIASGATLTAGSYHLTVGGKWTNTSGTWSYGTSTVTFDGSGYRDIKHTSGGAAVSETFYDIAFNRSSGSTTLNSPVIVNHSLTLTKGRIKTSSSFYLELIDNATCTAASDSAYVHGPVRKTGDDAFTFPLGDTTLADSIAYHPLAMTAPSVVTDQFEAEYFAAGQTLGDSLVDSLIAVSDVEYWRLSRNAGSSNIIVTLGWNYNSLTVQDLNALRMASWDGARWLDLGAASITVNQLTGTLTAQFTPSYSSTVANLAFAIPKVSVPVALLKKKLDGGYYQAINGRLFFRFDEEYNDSDNKLRFNIYDDQHTLVTSDQLMPAALQPAVQYGDNRYQLNTIGCQFSPTGALPNGFYILEVINEKNERWYLRFKQSSTITLTNCFTNPGSPQ